MASTIITFEIPVEETPRAIKALCQRAKLPESAVNARKAVIQWVESVIVEENTREAEQSGAETVKSPKGIK
jgi:hypothetical protein